MGYICVKKLKLAGREYLPGDSIPEEAFVSGRADKLKAYGYIAEAGEPESTSPEVHIEPTPAPVFNIMLGQNDTGESVTIAMTEDHLQAAVDLLRKSAADAVAAVGDETDETVLLFVANVDNRKTVTQAAQKQLAAIAAVQADQ